MQYRPSPPPCYYRGCCLFLFKLMWCDVIEVNVGNCCSWLCLVRNPLRCAGFVYLLSQETQEWVKRGGLPRGNGKGGWGRDCWGVDRLRLWSVRRLLFRCFCLGGWISFGRTGRFGGNLCRRLDFRYIPEKKKSKVHEGRRGIIVRYETWGNLEIPLNSGK